MTPTPTPTPTPTSTSHSSRPTFPPHSAPRTWLITACTSPIGIAIARQALSHGDNVIAGLNPRHIADFTQGEGGEEEEEEGDTRRGDGFRDFWRECEEEGWKERCKGLELDGRCEGPVGVDCLVVWFGSVENRADVGKTV